MLSSTVGSSRLELRPGPQGYLSFHKTAMILPHNTGVSILRLSSPIHKYLTSLHTQVLVLGMGFSPSPPWALIEATLQDICEVDEELFTRLYFFRSALLSFAGDPLWMY